MKNRLGYKPPNMINQIVPVCLGILKYIWPFKLKLQIYTIYQTGWHIAFEIFKHILNE